MQNSEMDKAWNSIFKKYGILAEIDKNGRYQIKASQMKEFREPRLLAKQDHDYDRPEIFKKHYLSMLPVSRTQYEIGHMSLYLPLSIQWENKEGIKAVPKPTNSDTIDFDKISSESVAINSAHIAGILQDFLETNVLNPSGANGRMGTGAFSFRVDNLLDPQHPYEVMVENAQMEIDAGYESDDSLFIIEAKNSISHDLLIRQLYFPYRYWSGKTNKKVRPVFLFYNDGIYHLLLLSFSDPLHYNSIKVEKYQKYKIVSNNPINVHEIEALQNQVPENPTIPFPQADSMEKVIDILQRVSMGKVGVGCFDLQFYMETKYKRFTGRQVQYYANAARYLGLIVRSRPGYYQLTPIGREIIGLTDLRERNRRLALQILSHSMFLACYQYRKQKGVLLLEDAMQIMIDNPQCKLQGELLFRRAQTVKSWIDWIFETSKKKK